MNYFLGKLCIGSVFFLSGLRLALDANRREFVVSTMASHNIPLPYILIIIAISLKIIAGLMVMISPNKQVIRTNAFLLIGFIMVATWLFHNPLENKEEITNALKNFGIIGGLILLL